MYQRHSIFKRWVLVYNGVEKKKRADKVAKDAAKSERV